MSDQEDFEFRLRMEKEAESSQQPSTDVLTAPSASLTDKALGSFAGRMGLGAISPLIGAAQLGANIGSGISSYLPGHVEGGVMSGPWINQKIAELEASKQRGMKAYGNEGFDWAGLLGSLAPSTAIAKGVAAALPAATTLAGRMGIGAAQGAAASAAQPVTDTEGGFATPKAMQTGIGALAGGVIPAVSAGVEKLGNVVTQAAQPFTEKGRAAILKHRPQERPWRVFLNPLALPRINKI
jgi:hypothetical protein